MLLSVHSVITVLLLFVVELNGLRTSCRQSQRFRRSGGLTAVEPSKEAEKPKMTLGKLVQLMAMGAGAPMLGEFKEMDENGKMMFELEANNLVDSEGNSIQTKAKYFRDGYVEERSDLSPPGFWGNLLSGGKLQGEWEEKIRANKDTRK